MSPNRRLFEVAIEARTRSRACTVGSVVIVYGTTSAESVRRASIEVNQPGINAHVIACCCRMTYSADLHKVRTAPGARFVGIKRSDLRNSPRLQVLDMLGMSSPCGGSRQKTVRSRSSTPCSAPGTRIVVVAAIAASRAIQESVNMFSAGVCPGVITIVFVALSTVSINR